MNSEELSENIEPSVATDINKILEPLSFFEKSFVAHYIRSGFNGAAAYKATGRTVLNFNTAGSLVVRRPHVRKAIDELIGDTIITALEVLQLVSNIAKYSLNDYTEKVRTIEEPERVVDIYEYIAMYRKQIEHEYAVAEKLSENGRDVKPRYSDIDRMEDKLADLEQLSVTNPEMTFNVKESPQYVEKEVFSFDAMVKSGDRVQVQEITTYKDGSIKVKGYSSAEAHNTLLKVYGKFEKDNEQSAVKIKITNSKNK